MACCHCSPPTTTVSARYRKALWIALWINALMFGVEIAAGLRSGSVALFADAVDFAGDAANYGISLAVLALGLAWRARAAWLKGFTMLAFGAFVLGKTVWAIWAGIPPEPITMGVVGFVALIANVVVAVLLYAFRDGDANMRSVWLCSRNDALGNIAVMLAAGGVLGTSQGWPDLLVALIMSLLAWSAGVSVIRLAKKELSEEAVPCHT